MRGRWIALRHFSIRYKITGLVLLLVIAAGTVGFVSELGRLRRTFHEEMLSGAVVEARLLAEYCIAPLVFDDPERIDSALATLRSSENVRAAHLFDLHGNLVARHEKGDDPVPPLLPQVDEQHVCADRYMYVRQALIHDGEHCGTLVLCRSTRELNARIERSIGGLVAITGGLLLLTLLIVKGLHRTYARPILGLAAAIERISRDADYSLRVRTDATDEIGTLYDGFNAMLRRLQERRAERDQARAALQASEERYRSLVHDSPGLICRFLPDGRIDFVNDRFCRYFGKQRQELIGAHFLPLASPEERADVLARLRVLTPDAPTMTHEHRVILDDGQIHWQRWSNRALFDEAGMLVAFQGHGKDITDQKRTEDALRDSEARLRSFLENVDDMVYFQGLDGELICLNGANTRITGYSQEEFRRDPHLWRRIVHPDDLRVAEEFSSKQAGRAETNEVLYRLRTRDGEERWIQSRMVAVRDGRGKMIGYNCIDRDVTEQRRAEEEVRQMKTLVDRANFGIYIADPDGTLTYVNEFFAALLGYRPDELLGESIEIFHDSRQQPRAEELKNQILENGNVTATEHWYTTRDGRKFPMLMNGVAIRDDQGKPLFIGVTGTDMTELKSAVVAQNRLATAIDQASEIVVITDPAGAIEYVNPALATLTGQGPETVLQEDVQSLLAPEEQHATREQLRAALRQQRDWQGRLLCRGQSGASFETYTTLSPVRDETGELVNHVFVIRDISEVARLEARLRQSQKMEAIGTLASGIAHDFNNILYAIQGFTELAHDDAAPDSTSRTCLDQVRRAIRRACGLVQRILTFSREREAERKPLRLQPILKETIQLLESTLPATIELRRSIASDCSGVIADPTEIHQIVMNLGTNACHAMREQGGTLEIGLEEILMEGAEICRRHGLREGRYAVLSVRDTGSGMDRETQQKVFDPYFTTKPIGEGTGFGLSTVHGIVHALGGTAEVESRPGHGSLFRVYLPVHEQDVIHEEEEEEPIQPSPGGHESILVVDDEEQIVKMTSMILERNGYAVTGCSSPREALRIFEESPDAFDLVITDQTMPEMTGAELAREMERLRPQMPVILCSGFTEANVWGVEGAGATREFLQKPPTRAELERVVQRVLARLHIEKE